MINAPAPETSAQDLDPVGVDHDVLAGRKKRHQQRQHRDQAQLGFGIA
jgi:hypothetical protein